MGITIGTAGWSIARKNLPASCDAGSALERYAQMFRGVEINSSFYKSHRASTWARWREAVPDDFRFAVKLPKAITHEAKLIGVDALVSRFAREVSPLSPKLAVLLVQLPPKLGFDLATAERFFGRLRACVEAHIACEPRNATWFGPDADRTLERFRVARVAADPALLPFAAEPGGWREIAYWRLHGSPVMYRSAYSDEALSLHAERLKAAERKGVADIWSIFDNTAASHATNDALALARKLGR